MDVDITNLAITRLVGTELVIKVLYDFMLYRSLMEKYW